MDNAISLNGINKLDLLENEKLLIDLLSEPDADVQGIHGGLINNYSQAFQSNLTKP